MTGLGFVVTSSQTPSTAVIFEQDMDDEFLQKLRAQTGLEADEKILAFYTIGLFDFEDEGNIITDVRVISYETVDGETTYYWIFHDEIRQIRRIQDGGITTDTYVRIDGEEEDGWLVIALSAENDNDERAIELLEELTGVEETPWVEPGPSPQPTW